MSFLTMPDSARLRYAVHGDDEDTVVLVHGWKGSHRLWDPVMPGLATRYRVIAFDNRGMGESDAPTGPYDFALLAEDLSSVLEQLGAERVTLVGWSMGCSIALEYLARGGDRAARLVLVNGPVKLEKDDDFPWGIPPGELDNILDRMVRDWPAAELQFARESVRDEADAYAAIYYQVALQTSLIDSIKIAREQAQLDHRSLLERLELPVLAAYGRHDPYYDPYLAEYIAAKAADGRFVIFEESAHSIHREESERFVKVISDFTRGDT